MSRKDYFKEENKLKKTAMVFSITLLLTIVAFIVIFNLYNKKLMEEAQKSLLELGSINAVVPNERVSENTSFVSSSNDKGINEVKNETMSKNSAVNKSSNIDKNSNSEDNISGNIDNSLNSETANTEVIEDGNVNDNTKNMNVENSLDAETNIDESQDIKLMAPVSRRNIERFC